MSVMPEHWTCSCGFWNHPGNSMCLKCLRGKPEHMQAVVTQSVPKTDDINHPQHYARWKMEPIEFIMLNDLPAWMANVIKYIMRYDAKDGIKDMYKARSYLDMKIRQMEGVERFWEKPVAEERKLNKK